MTTSSIKGRCAIGCGRLAQLKYYKDGMVTPICFECFRDGYDGHWRLEPVRDADKTANVFLDEPLPFETDDEWPEETQPFQEVRVRCVHGALFGDSCDCCGEVLGRNI